MMITTISVSLRNCSSLSSSHNDDTTRDSLDQLKLAEERARDFVPAAVVPSKHAAVMTDETNKLVKEREGTFAI